MRRREFITFLGGAAVALPLAGRAQQGERMRRIGVLVSRAEDDPEGQAQVAAFVQTMQSLGWTTGRNVQIDIRWGAADAASSRRYAAEMVALAPDVILTASSAATVAVQEVTRTLPIVFVNVSDPVGAGYVASLARPGGNVTGFTFVEYGMSGKWLELLKEIAPGVTRVAILREPWPLESASWVQFSLWRPLSGWKRARSTSAMRTRLSVPLRISRAPRMAA